MPTRELVFEGTRHHLWTGGLLVAAIIAAVCLVLLYRYERRLVPPRLGMALLALRLAAGGVLVLALLEPQWTTAYSRQSAGRIVVAVDVSQSMDTSDKSLTDAEALRLARALGIIGNEETQAELDEWIADLERNGDPAVSPPEETGEEPAPDANAGSRRVALQAIRDEMATLPRSEIAQRLLTSGQTPLLDRLAPIGPVERHVFADIASEATPDGFGDSIVQPPESLRRGVTDLSQPLTVGDDDRPLTAVIMLTDGRDTAGRDAALLAATADSAGAPIYPVLIGSQQRRRDLAVSAIDAPASVFENDRPAVRVGLRTTGFAEIPIEVSVSPVGEAENVIATETVVPSGDSAEVRFELPPETVGRRRYTVSVRGRPGETRADNNSRNFAIQVVDDRVRVLLLDGDARWEFRYLTAAMQRDERVDATPVLFRQPYLGLLPDTFFAREFALPANADAENPFGKFDAVLLGDVAPANLSEQFWKLLGEYVRDSAGTLVLMAGKHHMPHDYRSEEFQEMLPVEQLQRAAARAADAELPPDQRGFRLQVTPDGDAAGVLTLDGNPIKNRRIWDELPGHVWGLRGRAKPGSTVWATGVRADESPDLESERESAIIVERNVGAGRVVWIGIDSTWRWRSRTGDLYHHRFWGQLVRSAAEFKAASHTDFVQFGPDRPQIRTDEAALFRARWSESFLRRHPDLVASVELTPIEETDEQGAVTAALAPADERPLEFEARISGLAPGEYHARLVVENTDAELDNVSADLLVQQHSSPELKDVTADPSLLEQMAQASGGQLLLPDQLDDLPAMLRGEEVSEQLRRTFPLWNHWSLLALFCALVGTEWVLRKFHGLP